MKKIVLLSSKPNRNDQFVAMVAEVFPECAIEIVSGADEGSACLPVLGDNAGDCGLGTTIDGEK